MVNNSSISTTEAPELNNQSDKRRNMKNIFTHELIKWHLTENKRTMPWKEEKEPYKIWISEIILQQTRVEQALPYYNKFIKAFPTIESLALAADESVYKVWEGLGYYTRCKNIIYTARYIFNNLNSKFPRLYNDILALKGIGPYTAAAISSFAYGLPHAVLDGNVFRVLSRYFGKDVAIDSAKGKEYFTTLANEVLYKKDPAAYNQAIMDFGATICKPQVARCIDCIFQLNCVAYQKGLVNKLPVKEKQLIKKKRWFTYLIFNINDRFLINKRTEKDIWQNLHEFYLVENNKLWNGEKEEIEDLLLKQLGIQDFTINKVSEIYSQQLTHQHLQGRFINITINKIPAVLSAYKPVKKEELLLLAFPKFITQYLQHQERLG
jgi:A/G-specific adenine glycosylase